MLEGTPVRVVESQEQIAANTLVDSLAEQALLEASKPAAHPEAAGLHYLLATPFRYPPLRHGSRFGARHESGIYYRAAVADPAHYSATQALGSALSAADNVAIFTPRAFTRQHPVWQEAWLCETTAGRVVYTGKGAGPIAFERAGFLVDDRLPEPAV